MTTVVLAASAVAVAAVCREVTSCVEFRWLVYPVLVAGGIKLVVDDFRHSSPSTLFAALAVYGVALILAPRIPPAFVTLHPRFTPASSSSRCASTPVRSLA